MLEKDCITLSSFTLILTVVLLYLFLLYQQTRAGRAVSFECRYEAMTTHYTSTNHQMDNFPIGDFPMGNRRVIHQCPMSQQVLDVEEEIQE